MIRRDFLRRILYGGTALAATGAAGRVLDPRMNGAALAHLPLNLPGTDLLSNDSQSTDPQRKDPQITYSLPNLIAIPFRLEDVKILDPDLLRMREQTLNYLLALDSDRLLHNFRVNAKLPSTAEPLYNRESPTNGWRGHYVGHFLSACSQMYASTGDVRIKTKADAMVAELAKCQAQLGDKGYLSAFPESGFDDLEQGRPAAVVWYALHKIMAGMFDVHERMQNPQALQVLEGMASWTDWRTGRLPEEQMQRTLQIEFGGMNEVLANLSAATGDSRYLVVAKRFDHHAVMDPAAQGRDTLTTLHANTQIPKFIGAAREFELTGDPYYRDGAQFFWQQVALHRSYVTGGNSASEHFRTPPDVLASQLTDLTQETCNTYNMLKLTRQLFTWQAEPQYADYYERAFLNHILATPNPADGSPLYYLGMQSGQWKVHFVPHEGYFCCCGTGLENFSKLSEGFYFHNEQSLWVNLFVASAVNWREKGVVVRQETRFPEEAGTRLIIQTKSPTRFILNVRIPYWAENASVTVNGKRFQPNQKLIPSSYAKIHRTWKNGDRVAVKLPMRLHLQSIPDDPTLAAIMYGPLVLAGELGMENLDPKRIYSDDKFLHGGFPAIAVPELAGDRNALGKWIQPVSGKDGIKNRPLTFRTAGTGRSEEVTLSPFYRLFDQRYCVYWRFRSAVEA
ncbi:MAG: beta-L-arabinofuranosidase domain-containing protein [Candidatus Sulfotelmatobacter sp.]